MLRAAHAQLLLQIHHCPLLLLITWLSNPLQVHQRDGEDDDEADAETVAPPAAGRSCRVLVHYPAAACRRRSRRLAGDQDQGQRIQGRIEPMTQIFVFFSSLHRILIFPS
jgi:hypothetical protein